MVNDLQLVKNRDLLAMQKEQQEREHIRQEIQREMEVQAREYLAQQIELEK
jgi:hypothetical protein